MAEDERSFHECAVSGQIRDAKAALEYRACLPVYAADRGFICGDAGEPWRKFVHRGRDGHYHVASPPWKYRKDPNAGKLCLCVFAGPDPRVDLHPCWRARRILPPLRDADAIVLGIRMSHRFCNQQSRCHEPIKIVFRIISRIQSELLRRNRHSHLRVYARDVPIPRASPLSKKMHRN